MESKYESGSNRAEWNEEIDYNTYFYVIFIKAFISLNCI